jgi:cell division GTPase FtsZ
MSDDFNFGDFESREEKVKAEITDAFTYSTAFRIGIVGIGQGGNNLARSFWNIGYRRVLLVNSAATDLDSIPEAIPKLLIGEEKGAGKDPVAGERFVKEQADKIRYEMIRNFGNFDKIIVCTGLGGGTGSGGSPQLIEIAKDIITAKGGNPKRDVIVMLTLVDPNLEGPRPCFNALTAYGKIAKLGVPLIVIDNSRVQSFVKSKLLEGWTKVNDWIVKAFHQFNRYANVPSDIGSFDGNDFNDVIEKGNLLFSVFALKTLESNTIVDKLITNLRNNTFASADISSSTAAGCVLLINEKSAASIEMDDLTPVFSELHNVMKKNSTLHRGIYILRDAPNAPPLTGIVVLAGPDKPEKTLEGLLVKSKNYDPSYATVSSFFV